jgi:hypothetical protein
MRLPLLILLTLSLAGTSIAGSRTEVDLRKATESFDRALEGKDTTTLNRVLSPKLRYGHSNAWIESKEELKANLFNGKLTYNAIKATGTAPQITIEEGTGLVRSEVQVEVTMNGKPMSFNLSVLQVWIYQKGEWRLIGRQSTKL